MLFLETEFIVETELLVVRDIEKDADKLARAAELIKSGALVAIPTETVYGLGANALDEDAVRRIYEVKGRPQDNPLIIHIADSSELYKYCENVPGEAVLLAERFWPGPLTMILRKKSVISDAVSAGLETVAVRCPEHFAALEIIRLAGVPIAAPSANISGSPSPTEPGHVLSDLEGKIPAIVDGGVCRVGLESTIVDLSAKPFCILRPGGITPEQISGVIGSVELDASLTSAFQRDRPKAPGMKYRHYAPKAKVVIIKGDTDEAARYINKNSSGADNVSVLCFDGEEGYFSAANILAYGKEQDYAAQAKNLFSCLRRLDTGSSGIIYARMSKTASRDTGVGLAVTNRLIKAAGFNIVEV